MPLKKPFRICNDHRSGLLTMIQQHFNGTLQPTLKIEEQAYELCVSLPYAGAFSFLIFIEDHILNVCVAERMTGLDIAEAGLRIFLPADIHEDMVRAYSKPYGIKVVMPKRSMTKAGKRIAVPLSACK